MVKAARVAKDIAWKHYRDHGEEIDKRRLGCLMYLCNRECFALNAEPLFSEALRIKDGVIIWDGMFEETPSVHDDWRDSIAEFAYNNAMIQYACLSTEDLEGIVHEEISWRKAHATPVLAECDMRESAKGIRPFNAFLGEYFDEDIVDWENLPKNDWEVGRSEDSYLQQYRE